MKILSAVLTCCLLPQLLCASVEVKGLRVWTSPEDTKAVIDLSGQVDYKLFQLNDPPRVVVDISNTQLNIKLDLKSNPVIKKIRNGKKDNNTLRLVFDLNSQQKARSFLLKPAKQYGHRLVIQLDKHKTEKKTVKQIHKNKDRDIIIAVDAGHGGEDPGASGSNGTKEKTITLQIAKKLAISINKESGMKAILIRKGDYYVALNKRFEKARDQQADLFVSIHADAFHDPKVHGMSVYILSKKGASSEAAKWLAQSENNSDLVGGVVLENKDNVLAKVLLDLSQNAALEASLKSAKKVLSALKLIEKPHKNYVERANFVVLRSPDVPSMLIETAYISNPKEEKRLNTREFQQKLANSIKNGIKNYFYQSPPPNTWIANHVKAAKHTVASGDTLVRIAKIYKISMQELKRLNHKTSNIILIGEVLVLPSILP
ncbi:MAG: N-acetylmuramoyl-L-alanine amidase [Alcanivoracaceae bacterium]|nr:N-acetylmuramoyl-L-alanine amidase [Alcanivoracaceae bacterium]